MEYLSPKDGGLLQSRPQVESLTPRRLRAELLILVLFLAVTASLALLCSRAMASPVPVVRVMVEREKGTIHINGFDLLVSEADSNRKIAHEDRKASLTVRCSLGGKMDVSYGRSKRRQASGPLHVVSLGGFIRVGNSQYRDDLYVYSFNGDCIVVNHVDLEKYVAGLLNSEMSAKWSSNTLMAQAVAARTYAIFQMKEGSSARYTKLSAPFDLDSSVKDQVYEGANHERYKALRAVQETRGMILSYAGKPIKAFYHSTCGGHTESPEKVWGKALPYIRPVKCGYCDNSPRFNWVYSIPSAVLERKLRAEKLLKGAFYSMRVVLRNAIGRAEKVEVRGSGGNTLVGAARVRSIVGNLNLRSTDFTVASSAGQFVFVGHGSGHAVGMCQWGAKTMGERGYAYNDILKHYYPDAQLTKLY